MKLHKPQNLNTFRLSSATTVNTLTVQRHRPAHLTGQVNIHPHLAWCCTGGLEIKPRKGIFAKKITAEKHLRMKLLGEALH